MQKFPPLWVGADKGYPHPGADKGADNRLCPRSRMGPVPPLCWLSTLEVSNASTVPCGAAPAAQVPLLKQSADKGADNQLAPHQNLKAVSSLRLNEVVSNASTVPSGAAPAARVPLLKQSAAKK